MPDNEIPVNKAKSGAGFFAALLVAAVVKFKSILWLGASLVSMLLSVVVFGQRDGIPYGISVVLLILIHESGHWIWMKALGLEPKAPMFIPGLGAFVAMTKLPPNESLHAWVALAGPLIGGVGCAVLYALGVHMDNRWLTDSSNTGFMLNLLQLIPAKPLDGGFVVHAVSRWLLVPGTIALFLLALATGAPLLYLIAIISLLSWRQAPEAARKNLPSEPTAIAGGAQPLAVTALKATGWERVAIAFAYLSLIGALTLGLLLSHLD